MTIYNQNRSHNIDMFIPNEQVRQTILHLSNYGGTDPDTNREDFLMTIPDPTYDQYRKADRKAKKLARQIMGKSFDKLMKKKYLIFKIKVRKQKGKIVTQKMYLFRDIVLYLLDEKVNRLIRICSLIQETSSYQDSRFSDYDKLIAFYLWLKHYNKHPIKQLDFKDKFNVMSESGNYTVREVLSTLDSVRYMRR